MFRESGISSNADFGQNKITKQNILMSLSGSGVNSFENFIFLEKKCTLKLFHIRVR